MKKLLLVAIAVVVFAVSEGLAQMPTPAPVTFTEKDREMALRYMNDTKADYLEQLKGLSDAQLNFRAAEGRWTIAEIAEHITVVEEMLSNLVLNGTMKPATSKCDNPLRVSDGLVLAAITNRGRRATAPEPVTPKGRWNTIADLTANFERVRGGTIDYMKNNKADLRAVFGPTPFGMVDGFQQIMFVVGHSERHLAQLKEVKADPKYPKK